jgi:hypothetical protein
MRRSGTAAAHGATSARGAGVPAIAAAPTPLLVPVRSLRADSSIFIQESLAPEISSGFGSLTRSPKRLKVAICRPFLLNRTASKTVRGPWVPRGFESHPLRSGRLGNDRVDEFPDTFDRDDADVPELEVFGRCAYAAHTRRSCAGRPPGHFRFARRRGVSDGGSRPAVSASGVIQRGNKTRPLPPSRRATFIAASSRERSVGLATDRTPRRLS